MNTLHKVYFKDKWMLALVCYLMSGLLLCSAQTKVFRAGAAATNITPNLGMGIVGNFGTPPPATHIHDELFAKCLVLDDGTTKLAIVIVDNIGVTSDVVNAAKKIIFEETGLPAENVLLAATHTHSSVSARSKARGWNLNNEFDAYQTFLIRRVADGVRLALNNLEPAQIAWGAGQVPQHVFNRRWLLKEKIVNPYGQMDQVQFNPGHANPNKIKSAGPVDPEVVFLSIQSLNGRPIGLLANYSLHYVGGIPKDHISGDYFSVFADRMQELLKADRQEVPFVGIMSHGTAGDVNNVNFAAPKEQHKPYEKMRIVAHDVAKEVYSVVQTLNYQKWVPLRAMSTDLELAIRKPSAELLAQSEKILQRPDSEKGIHPLDKSYATRIIQLQSDFPSSIKVPLQTLGIGDLGISAIPFEVFTETGLAIKKKSPFKKTFTIELANGSFGYLPTPEQHKLGGYETWLGSNVVEIEASTKIEKKILELFNKIK